MPSDVELADFLARSPAAGRSEEELADFLGGFNARRDQLQSYAEVLSRTPPLGVGEHAAAVKVAPEDRALLAELARRQYAADQSMKKAGFGARLATSVVQGAVDFGMPLAKFVGAVDRLDPDQERFKQDLLAVREGVDPTIRPDTPLLGRGVQQAGRMTVPMVQSVGLGKAAGATGRAAGLQKAGVAASTAAGTSGSYLPQIADQTYTSLIGEGVDPDVARRITLVSAPIEAAVESILPDPFSGYGAAFKGTARQVAGKLLQKYTVNFTKELTEEGLQGVINETAMEVGRRMDEDIPDKGLGNILMRGVSDMKESALPLAILMAPGAAVGGVQVAKESAARKERLAQLKQVRAKGYISEVDGQSKQIPGETRQKRLASANAEIRELEQEAEDARTVQSPEAEVREKPSGPHVRGPGEVEVPAEPTGEVAPASEVSVGDAEYERILKQLQDMATREDLESAVPLMRSLFPEYADSETGDDPWGIRRAIFRGDELPRIPTVELNRRIREAKQRGELPEPVSPAPEVQVGEAGQREYPAAGDVVDGRNVRGGPVPNTDSIDATLDDYELLPGVREVPMSDFELTGKHYSTGGTERIRELQEAIEASGEITPLIVVVEDEGPYILEGATRADALYNLGAKSFPALVVDARTGRASKAPEVQVEEAAPSRPAEPEPIPQPKAGVGRKGVPKKPAKEAALGQTHEDYRKGMKNLSLSLVELYREQNRWDKLSEKWARIPNGESQAKIADERAAIVQEFIDQKTAKPKPVSKAPAKAKAAPETIPDTWVAARVDVLTKQGLSPKEAMRRAAEEWQEQGALAKEFEAQRRAEDATVQELEREIEELPKGPARTTGTKHAKTDELRERAKLGKRVMPTRQTEKELDAEAARVMAKDPSFAGRLAADVSAEPRPLRPIEEHVLGRHIRDLENRRLAGEDVQGEMVSAVEAASVGGTEEARAFRARQEVREADFSLPGIVRQHIESVKGRPTEEQTVKYEGMANRIKRLEAERDALQARVEQATPAPKKGTKRHRLQREAAESISNFKDEWATLFQTGAVYDPKREAVKWARITKAAGRVVAAHAKLGLNSLAEVLDRVAKDTGPLAADQERAFREAWEAHTKKSPRKGFPGARRLRVAEARIDRQIADLEADLAAGRLGPKKKLPPVTSEALEAKRHRLAELYEARDRAREASLEYQAQEAARQADRYRKSLERQQASWEGRREEAQRGILPRKPARKAFLERDILEKKAEIAEVKSEAIREINRVKRERRPAIQKAAEVIPEALNAVRAIMTSFDLSAVLRQGGVLSAAHPMLSKDAFVPMLKAFSSERGQAVAAEAIKDLPSAELAQRAGLEITTDAASLSAMEEAYMSRLASRIPGVSHSARAYMTFLNTQRAVVFDALVAKLGRKGEVTLDEAKIIANWVNIASGRGNMGRAQGAATALATGFFAPRYVLSRFQLLLGQPLWTGLLKGQGGQRARALVAKEYARLGTALSLFYGTFALMAALLWDPDDEGKPTVTFDTRSADFGKLKFGDTRVDPLSGLAQVTTLLGRLGRGETVSARGEVRAIRGKEREFISPTVPGVIGRFVRSKLSPAVGTALDILTGENVVGEEATLETELVPFRDPARPLGAATPLIWEDVYEAMLAQGATKGTALGILAILGASSQTYGDRFTYERGSAAERKEQFEKDLKHMKWNTPPLAYSDLLSPKQRKQAEQRRAEKKRAAVYAAFHEPDRETHQSDETFEVSIAKRDNALEAFREMGLSHDEAQEMLAGYFWQSGKKGKIGNEKEDSDLKDAYMDRGKALAKLYDEDFQKWRKAFIAGGKSSKRLKKRAEWAD